MTEDRKIYMFMNAYFSRGYGLSGGDKRSFEILRRWQRDEKSVPTLIAPGKIFHMLQEEKISIQNRVITSTERSESGNILAAYITHTRNANRYIRSLIRKQRQKNTESREQEEPLSVFYTTSDYFTDVVPASYGRRQLNNSCWVAIIHHIIEDYHTRPGNRLRNWIAYREQQWCIRKTIRSADRILTVSPLVYQYLLRRGVDEKRLRLISNGIDDEMIANSIPSTDPARQYDGIFVARFAPSKGIMEFPSIWKTVTDAVPKARLCLIGEGSPEMIQKLQEEFRTRGIGDLVDMPGFLSSADMYSYLKSAKVCLFPSHEEGWGIAIAEAMGCGLPVVTYALPVFPEIFHYINLECPVGDTQTFAQNVILLLQNEEERCRRAEKGKELIDYEYTWNKVADREWELLHEDT